MHDVCCVQQRAWAICMRRQGELDREWEGVDRVAMRVGDDGTGWVGATKKSERLNVSAGWVSHSQTDRYSRTI